MIARVTRAYHTRHFSNTHSPGEDACKQFLFPSLPPSLPLLLFPPARPPTPSPYHKRREIKLSVPPPFDKRPKPFKTKTCTRRQPDKRDSVSPLLPTVGPYPRTILYKAII